MISKASVSFSRISPRKVRYVIDLIRAKSVPQAQAILNGSPRRAGGIVSKLLKQAVDAAEKNSQIPAARLVVSKVLADGGPSMKRFRAASMGRASKIKKRTSHISIELDTLKKEPVPAMPPPRRTAEKASVPGTAAVKKSAKMMNKKTVGAK